MSTPPLDLYAPRAETRRPRITVYSTAVWGVYLIRRLTVIPDSLTESFTVVSPKVTDLRASDAKSIVRVMQMGGRYTDI